MWFERDGEGFSHLGNERRARLFLGFIDMNLLLLVTGRERSAEMEMTDSWLRRTFNVNVERHQKSFRINHVSFVKLIEISSRDVHHRGLSSVANWLCTCWTSCPYHGSINFRPRLLLTTLRDWHKLVEKNYRKTFLIFLDGCCSSRSAKRQVVSREVEITCQLNQNCLIWAEIWASYLNRSIETHRRRRFSNFLFFPFVRFSYQRSLMISSIKSLIILLRRDVNGLAPTLSIRAMNNKKDIYEETEWVQNSRTFNWLRDWKTSFT